MSENKMTEDKLTDDGESVFAALPSAGKEKRGCSILLIRIAAGLGLGI